MRKLALTLQRLRFPAVGWRRMATPCSVSSQAHGFAVGFFLARRNGDAARRLSDFAKFGKARSVFRRRPSTAGWGLRPDRHGDEVWA